MSAILDKLLKGRDIEWFQLGQVAEYSKSRISYDKVDEEIYVGVDNLLPNQAGKTNSNYLPKSGTLIEYIPNDILIGNIRPYLKKIWHSDRSGGTNGDVLVIRSIYNELNPRYLYQVLSDNSFFNYNVQNSKGAKMPRGDKEAILKYLIPIPPLDVQAEIVRILDAFTALTAELTAELNMREKQYQYYRDKLLTFSDNEIIWKSLGEVVKMQAGKNIKASQIHPSQTDKNLYPCFGGNGIRGYVNNLSHQGEYVIIGRQGALCGNVQRVKGNFYATEHAVVVTVSDLIDVDWAYHMLSFMNLNQYASKSAQPGLAVGKLELLEIPVPSLSEQKRVAKILDKLDTITHSITQGLPKEITLRQRQYEYYREQLIDFPKN